MAARRPIRRAPLDSAPKPPRRASGERARRWRSAGRPEAQQPTAPVARPLFSGSLGMLLIVARYRWSDIAGAQLDPHAIVDRPIVGGDDVTKPDSTTGRFRADSSPSSRNSRSSARSALRRARFASKPLDAKLRTATTKANAASTTDKTSVAVVAIVVIVVRSGMPVEFVTEPSR
jgi:hypothetical protein